MKKQALFARAEGMYVSGEMTFEEIASALGTCEKTIRLWADENGWRNKREKFRASLQSIQEREASLHEKLHDFTNQLMDNVLKSWNSGEQVDPGRLYALTRLIDKLDKAKKFDAEVTKEKKNAESIDDRGLSEEVLRKIEQQIKMM